jgi:protein subunit release factor B
MISSEKWQLLFKRMLKAGINEDELQEKFILGSGSGGQKVNKSNTCVHLKHPPTNTIVKCQQERSRELNRYYARCRLCAKLEALKQEGKD